MSRYSDALESNIKGSIFTDLLEKVAGLSLGDLSQSDAVIEIKRLKKLLSYIQDILNSVDPELVPYTIWDSFPQYCKNAIQNLEQYETTKNIVFLQNTNNAADNILNLIRPYMITKGRTKKILENIHAINEKTSDELISSLQSKVDLKNAELEELLNTARLNTSLIQTAYALVQASHKQISGTETEKGILQVIEEIQADILAKNNEITALHEKLFTDKGKEQSVRSLVEGALDEIISTTNKIKALRESVEHETRGLREFYVKVFGKLNDDDEFADSGLAYEISERLKQLRELESSNKLRYEELLKQIESLLPGATSAGLATAYSEMKQSYKEPIKMFNRLFYGAIFLLAVTSIASIVDFKYGYPAGTIPSWEMLVKAMINKIPLFGALIWFAFFVSKRRSEAQRLQEEYAHKEALAKSYASYKKQIDALDSEDKELQKEFIGKMVDAIAFNASQTLDGNHGDKHPLQTVLEKLSDKIEGTISPAELLELIKRKS